MSDGAWDIPQMLALLQNFLRRLDPTEQDARSFLAQHLPQSIGILAQGRRCLFSIHCQINTSGCCISSRLKPTITASDCRLRRQKNRDENNSDVHTASRRNGIVQLRGCCYLCVAILHRINSSERYCVR